MRLEFQAWEKWMLMHWLSMRVVPFLYDSNSLWSHIALHFLETLFLSIPFPLLRLITSIICRETDQSVIQFGWHSPIVCPSMASLLSQDSDTVALCLCMHHTCVCVCVCMRQTAAATLGGASSISSHPVPTPSSSLYTNTFILRTTSGAEGLFEMWILKLCRSARDFCKRVSLDAFRI